MRSKVGGQVTQTFQCFLFLFIQLIQPQLYIPGTVLVLGFRKHTGSHKAYSQAEDMLLINDHVSLKFALRAQQGVVCKGHSLYRKFKEGFLEGMTFGLNV